MGDCFAITAGTGCCRSFVSAIEGVSGCTELLPTVVEVDNAVLLITAVGAGSCALATGEVNGFMGLEAEVVLVMDIKDGLVTNFV
jgi:hypothetical protein